MKKYIAALMLVIVFSSTSFAFLPLVVPMATAALLSYAVHAQILNGLYFYEKISSLDFSTITPTGTVTKPSEAVWIDLTLPTPAVVEKPVTATMPVSKLKELAAKPSSPTNPAGGKKYPLVENAITSPLAWPPQITAGSAVGDVVYVPGYGQKIVSAKDENYYSLCSTTGAPAPTYSSSDVRFYRAGATSGAPCYSTPQFIMTKIFVNPDTTQPPPPAAVPDSQIPGRVAENGVSGKVKTSLQSELDAMFQDPDYVPVFTDDTTGLPYAAPPSSSVATPSQVDTYNKLGNAANPSTTTTTGTPVVTNNPNGTSTTTTTTITTGGPNGTVTGTSSTTTSGLNGTGSVVSTTGTSATSGNAVTAADVAAASAITAPGASAAYGDTANRDFSARFNTFLTSMKSGTLFSMPTTLLGTIPSGGNSAFNLSFGRMGSTTFDLASYASAIALIRILVLFTFSVTCLKIITLKGGSG